MSNLNEQNDELAAVANARVSRRNLLGIAGQGFLGIAALALLGKTANAAPRTTLERMLPGAKELGARSVAPGAGGIKVLGLDSSPLGHTPSLPFWGDGQHFDHPEYYETLCVGDVDNDGQDEMVVRGPAGVMVEHFDPGAGQWTTLTTAGPLWSDAEGWNDPKYFSTIRCTDVIGFGSAEIVGRGKNGFECYKYNSDTNKFAMIPGGYGPFSDTDDGGIWTQEVHYATIKWGMVRSPKYGLQWVIGRHSNGIVAHYYAEEVSTWYLPYFGYGPWPDNDTTTGTNWTLPQYYETIQIADIDGDGQEELLGRAATGIEVYKFDLGTNKWQKIYGGSTGNPTILSDAAGWNQPQYYQTIQCADIDGDGKAELLARGSSGIVAYRFDTTTKQFESMANGPAWSDGAGWSWGYSYLTIQFGDVDGDGAEEMIGRFSNGIQTWKYFPNYYDPTTGQSQGAKWAQLAGAATGNPAWTNDGSGADANGSKWDETQYYGTIHLARTAADRRTNVFLNPNTAPTRDGQNNPRIGPYATLIARDQYGIQTWRYQQADHQWRESGGTWSRTSAPLPDFTSANADPKLKAAYVALDAALRPQHTGNFRDVYNNQSAIFAGTDGFMLKLYDDPLDINDHTQTCKISAPSGIDNAAWQAVTWQIYWEMAYVNQVNDWFHNKMAGLINLMTFSQELSVQTVGDYMNVPSNDSTSLRMSIASLIFNGAWAVLGIPGLVDGESAFANLPGQLSALSGCLSTAFSAAALAADYFEGTWAGKYAEVQAELDNVFAISLSTNASLNTTITGGANGLAAYQPGDFGMMSAIGQQILGAATNSPWAWPTDTEAKLAKQAQHDMAIQLFRSLLPLGDWFIAYNSANSKDHPSTYFYVYSQSSITGGYYNPRWIATSWYKNPSYAEVDELFGTPSYGAIWPLGVSMTDVFEFQNGWPKLKFNDYGSLSATAPAIKTEMPTINAAIDLYVDLSRNAQTGNIEAELRMENHGLTAAANVEILSATLGNQRPIEPIPHQYMRIVAGKKWKTRIVFGTSGTPGQTVVLRIQGQYKGGTFGGNFRVKLP